MNLPKPRALRIERKSLAIDHLAVLHDRHVDAAAAFGIDQLMAWGIVSGYSPPWSNVSKRRPVPYAGLGGVVSANLWVSFIREVLPHTRQR